MEDGQGLKLFQGRVWVPKIGGCRELLLKEAYKYKYSIHPGSTRIYRDLKLNYWWLDESWCGELCGKVNHLPTSKGGTPMKVQKSPTSHHTRVEVGTYHHGLHDESTEETSGTWHYVGDSSSVDQECSLLSPMERLERLAKLYINEVISRHGVPLSIVSDRIVTSPHTFGMDCKPSWVRKSNWARHTTPKWNVKANE